jgi:DNA-binding SARP family transcriptional activator
MALTPGQHRARFENSNKNLAKTERAEYDIDPFGSISVTADSRRLSIRPPQQRAIFALLVINMNQLVPTDRIIDSIWRNSPPSRAKENIQACVSRLRRLIPPKTLGRHTVKQLEVRYSSPGYALIIDPERVSTYRFEEAVGEGKRLLACGLPKDAGRAFRNAMRLCRGVPYGDLSDYEFAVEEASRLEELRLAATAGWASSCLELGDYGSVIDLLSQDVQRHPFREDLVGYFMTALSRVGRRAEALRVYERTRSNLASELGIDTGDTLRSVYETILR